MPYIDADIVKTKRQTIRAAFPRKAGWDVSVTRRDHSTILVVFKKGPVALSAEGYEQINTTYIRKFAPSEEAAVVLEQANTIAADGNYTLYESGDYGDIPKFYVDIHVGAWNQPYQVTA